MLIQIGPADSSPPGHTDCGTEPLATAEQDRIYRAALAGTTTLTEAVALR